MNKNKKNIYRISGVVLLVLALLCAVFLIPFVPKINKVEAAVKEDLDVYFEVKSQRESLAASNTAGNNAGNTQQSGNNGQTAPSGVIISGGAAKSVSGNTQTVEQKPAETYTSPVDFKELQGLNPDIYAWLHIPGTVISYPIVQNPSDDTYYLKHNTAKRNDSAGAIFTEHYFNGTELSDPVTLIYGHHMKSGAMFGNLQKYYESNFAGYKTIYIMLPDKELKYEVFAAIPYGNEHLLRKYDFSDKMVYNNFFSELRNTRRLGAIVDQSAWPQNNENIIILSTCMYQYNADRYLVMAKLVK